MDRSVKLPIGPGEKGQPQERNSLSIELLHIVTRLCAINLLLHGIGPDADNLTDGMPVVTKDALAAKHGEYDIVLANPPFGKKSSVTIVNEAGRTLERIAHHQSRRFLGEHEQVRAALALQLNFLQHIFTILKQHGRAAVVLPDNVLFEGGAGETIRRALPKQADVHTLLRLPTGILIRSLPLAQPSAFPSHSLLPANSGLRPGSEGQRPLDSLAPAHLGLCPALRAV